MNVFISAREVIERNIFPILQGSGLAGRVLEARALYAVVLACCGDYDAAANEVERLLPFEDAMDPKLRTALQEQKAIIRDGRLRGGRPQRQVVILAPLQALFDQRRGAPQEVEPRKRSAATKSVPAVLARNSKSATDVDRERLEVVV